MRGRLPHGSGGGSAVRINVSASCMPPPEHSRHQIEARSADRFVHIAARQCAARSTSLWRAVVCAREDTGR